jgi:hypothetical protein
VSGPLASWAAEHAAEYIDEAVFAEAKVTRKTVVDVIGQLALSSYADGSSAYAPTWEELAHRTRTSRSTVAAALKFAVKHKLLTVDRPGRGRLPGGGGRPTIYRVQYALCGGCWACDTLTTELRKVRGPDLNRSRKGPGQPRKGPDGGRKGPDLGPSTENGGTASTSGGAVPPPESRDRGAGSTPNGAGPARVNNPTTATEEEMEAAVKAAIARGATT